MTWSDSDERAAREAASKLRPCCDCQSTVAHAYTAIRTAIEAERARHAAEVASALEDVRRRGEAAMRERAAEVARTRAALMRAAADEQQETAAQTAWELRMVAGKVDSVARDLAALPLTGEDKP